MQRENQCCLFFFHFTSVNYNKLPSWNRWNSEHLKRRTPNAECQTPNAERQKFWTDRSVVWILIFLEKWKNFQCWFHCKKFEKNFLCWIHWCWFHWKKFALLISLKKISIVDFIEKNFSNPKTDRPVVFKPQTPIFTDRPVVPFFVSYWRYSLGYYLSAQKRPQSGGMTVGSYLKSKKNLYSSPYYLFYSPTRNVSLSEENR